MIRDFNKDDSPLQANRYDVCICGAGAAGITLALYLSAKGKKVALLEGGDKDYSEQSQNLYVGKSVGMPYNVDKWRLRYLGGTTNHWAGRCRPFVKESFRDSLFNGLTGWPITFEEMDNYLPAAKAILGLPPDNTFNPSPKATINSEAFEPDRYINSDPVRFGKKRYDDLAKNANVDLFLNANVVNIALAENKATVEKVEIKAFGGKSDSVKATRFVLSMGTLENARILLNSNQQIPTGIGNGTDMVGRCFMEHLNFDIGGFVANPELWANLKGMQFYTKPAYSGSHNFPLGNFACGIVSEIKAYGRTKELKKVITELSCRLDLSEKLQFLFAHQCLGEGAITTMLEQFPNKDSRVYLDTEKDELGMNKLIVDWRLAADEMVAIKQLAISLGKDFATSNLGRVRLNPRILDPEAELSPGPHAHQMGTTRMAKDPKHGVVDVNSKVFETDNLYVAGSSVFSTGGGGNPTMPLIQLTLRLGDYLLAQA